MFLTRAISGIVLLAITLFAIIASGPLLYLFMLFISLVGMYELYRVFGMERKLPALAGYMTAITIESVILAGKTDWVLSVVVVGFLILMSIYVLTYPRYQTDEIIKAAFGMIYVGLLISFIFQTRISKDGAYTVWLIFISAWGCDTCAYLVGRAIGKHKMAPVLSPKKSVEGAVGGVAGGALIGAIYGYVLQAHLTEFANPAAFCAIIGACGGLISMLGDLSASAIKRNYNVKDYGSLIPGHGGIMDRFDSVIFTAPLIYILVMLLQRIA